MPTPERSLVINAIVRNALGEVMKFVDTIRIDVRLDGETRSVGFLVREGPRQSGAHRDKCASGVRNFVVKSTPTWNTRVSEVT